MRKPGRNPHLPLVLSADQRARPAPEIRVTAQQVDCHVKDLPLNHADQLTLWLANLIVQAPQYALATAAVVILDKLQIRPRRFGKISLVVAFKKESSVITKHLGFKYQDFRQRCGSYDIRHGRHSSLVG